MPRSTRLTLLTVMTAAAVTATACADSGDTASSATPTTRSSSSSAPPLVDVPPTPGGTALPLGKQAVIPYDDSIDAGTLGVTVTAVEPGDQAQYETQFGEDAQGSVPHYVHYTVENLGGTDLSTKSLFSLYGSTVKGETNTGVFLIGDVPDCGRVLSPEDFTTVGASFESCQLIAAPTGQDIVEVGYDKGDYDENPIVWTK